MQNEKIKLTFIGHSCFLIEHKGTQLIIDPFITDNPLAKISSDDLRVDYILLTHGHGDHFGDSLRIAQNNNATVIAPFELAKAIEKRGIQTHAMHIGGGYNFEFGRVKMTIAHHGSGADLGGQAFAYMGNPCGYVLTLGGKNIYHAGDTGLFLDMQLIGKLNHLDVALLPIGDNFTMGIDDAVHAVKFLKPDLTIPMHYNTFPLIQADPQEFVIKISKYDFQAHILDIHESIEI